MILGQHLMLMLLEQPWTSGLWMSYISHTAIYTGELTLKEHFCLISFILTMCMWKYFIWKLACVKAS